MATAIADVFRAEYSRVMAATVRRAGGDFELAEDAVQHAFSRALEVWGEGGVPDSPRAWLMRVASNRAVDVLRTGNLHRAREADVIDRFLADQAASDDNAHGFVDDRLRLICTCCHPALALEAQVALTLRTVCGLSSDDIASAFLVPPPTMAQRLVRAKRKIRAAKIPYRVPETAQLTARLEAICAVVYLVFNAGYSRPADTAAALCGEAEWLARLLLSLVPGDGEVAGLLALILLQGSRSGARVDAGGDTVLLEDQDRALWDAGAIEEGRRLVRLSLSSGSPGPYGVQAAIAAVHADARDAADTDWRQIVGLYDVLLRLLPTPIVQLNRAVAVAMAEGPEAGLAICDQLSASGELSRYPLLAAARADLLRRLGRHAEAADGYRAALELTVDETDRRFLRRRLAEVDSQ